MGFTAEFSFTGTISQGNDVEEITGTLHIRTGDVYLAKMSHDTISSTDSYEIEGSTVWSHITRVTWFKSEDGTPVFGQSTVSGFGETPVVKTSTPFDISELPSVAQVGASGTLTSWSKSDGTEQYTSWSLAPSTNGHALLIVKASVYNDITLIGTDYLEVKIDESGNRISFYKEVHSYQDDIFMVINATRTDDIQSPNYGKKLKDSTN